MTTKILLLLRASLFIGLMAGSDVAGQQILRTWTTGESTSIAWIEDVDGDESRDLVIGNAFHDLPGVSNAGRILVISGATGVSIRQHTGSARDYALGSCVYNVGDNDGDGKQDYGSRGGLEAFIFGGADGVVLLHRTAAGSVASMVSLGEVDGDARGEFAFGASIVAEVYQGGVATPRLVIPVPPQSLGFRFGHGSATASDLDGDLVPEFAFSAPSRGSVTTPSGPGHVYVFSGESGALLHDLWSPEEYIYARFGEGLASPGDLNGDGEDDFAVGSPDGTVPGVAGAGGVVRFYNGLTGEVMDHVGAPFGGGGDWGRSLTVAGDLNGNGYPDFLADYDDAASKTWMVAIDGKTKEVLLRFVENGRPPEGADWNGDDFPDYLTKVNSTTLALFSGAPDGVLVEGTGTTLQSGVEPRIGVTGSARPGAPVKFHLSRVAPGQDATLVIGLPRFHDGYMLGGRRAGLLRTKIYHAQAKMVRPGEGVATIELTVPNEVALTRTHFTATWLVLDPTGQLVARTRSLDFEILPTL